MNTEIKAKIRGLFQFPNEDDVIRQSESLISIGSSYVVRETLECLQENR